MKVLLTGGTGYIGSHCAVALRNAGHQLTLLDNFSNSDRSVLGRIKQLYQPSQAAAGSAIPALEFIQGDLCDPVLLDQVLAQGNFDAVLHFAGLKAVGESWLAPADYYHNNFGGTLLLAQLMQKHRVRCLLFSSSATVYAENSSGSTLHEQSPCAPISPYGRSKYFVEQMLQDLCHAQTDLSLIVLRYFNPAGAHPSGLLGEAPSGTPNNLLPFVAQVASGQRAELAVFGNDFPTHDGTGVRDYIHVEDLANGHLLALQQHHTQAGVHRYNLGRGQGYSVLEVLAAFERSCNRRLPYRIAARREGDLACTVACADKAKALLNFTAQHDLQQMTDDTWRWQQQLLASQSAVAAPAAVPKIGPAAMPEDVPEITSEVAPAGVKHATV